jgi:hypothetical protein
MKLHSLIYVSDKFKDIEITNEALMNGQMEESLSKFARFITIPKDSREQLEIYSYSEFFLMKRYKREGLLVAITSSLSETDEYLKDVARKAYLGEKRQTIKEYVLESNKRGEL